MRARARDGTRFPANCFVSSLFSPLSSLLSSFSFSFSLSFFFRPRVVLVHWIGPSDCDSVGEEGEGEGGGGEGVLWLDFENENATSRSNLAIGRCLSLLILGAGRKLAESYFHGEEREVTCLETTRWNAIRERRL